MKLNPNNFSQPIWYSKNDLVDKLILNYKKADETEDSRERRKKFIEDFAELLKEEKVTLAKSGMNFDTQREKIDTAVIHHTGKSSLEADNPIEYMNALQLLNLYTREFNNPKRSYFHTPLWSNHFIGGKMTFIAYHYVIWPDGSFQKTLEDKHIGWHAGNWGWNKRSIGIAILGDYSEESPTKASLISLENIFSTYSLKNVLPHYKTNPKTDCPGKWFEEWGQDLLVFN